MPVCCIFSQSVNRNVIFSLFHQSSFFLFCPPPVFFPRRARPRFPRPFSTHTLSSLHLHPSTRLYPHLHPPLRRFSPPPPPPPPLLLPFIFHLRLLSSHPFPHLQSPLLVLPSLGSSLRRWELEQWVFSECLVLFSIRQSSSLSGSHLEQLSPSRACHLSTPRQRPSQDLGVIHGRRPTSSKKHESVSVEQFDTRFFASLVTTRVRLCGPRSLFLPVDQRCASTIQSIHLFHHLGHRQHQPNRSTLPWSHEFISHSSA